MNLLPRLLPLPGESLSDRDLFSVATETRIATLALTVLGKERAVRTMVASEGGARVVNMFNRRPVEAVGATATTTMSPEALDGLELVRDGDQLALHRDPTPEEIASNLEAMVADDTGETEADHMTEFEREARAKLMKAQNAMFAEEEQFTIAA